MAERVRDFDWASTTLGPLVDWPQSLRSVVDMMVASPQAMCLIWGPDQTLVYNDGYAPLLGLRHPSALGLPLADVWAEIWSDISPLIDQTLSGTAVALTDLPLLMTRKGYAEETWWSFAYSPLRDETGAIAGLINICQDTSQRVLAERRQAEAQTRLELTLAAGQGVGTWDWDVTTDRVTADARFAELYGVDPDLAKAGAPLAQFFAGIHPDDRDRVTAQIQQTLGTGAPFRSEYRLVKSDGEVRWVVAEGGVVRAPDGTPLRFPGVTFDITDRRATDAALAESETRYDTLFNTIGSGFCIIQMKFDEDMRPVDYMIVEGNPAFSEMTGLHDANGKWVSEIAPGLERHWFELYGRVALTGETARFENPADVLGRWYDVEALRIGDPDQHRVAILFNNITERKRSEARQAALIVLDDAIVDLTDPAEIGFVAARILGEALGAMRVGYGVIDAGAETVVIERDWRRGEALSVAGVHVFRDYGDYVADILTGEAAVIDNVETDPRIADPGPLLAYGIRALMDVPVVEKGVVVAQFLVHAAEPKAWSAEEVAYVRTFAERTRAAIARREAEADRRDSEARYRTLFDTMDEGFCIIEFFDGPHGPDSDYVHVEANPAYAANAGIENVVGQTLRQMVGDEAQSWVDRYGAVLRTGEPIHFEQELVATGRWLELSAFRIEPAERKQVAVLFQDLTSRKHAEIALRDSEERLRLAMEAGGHGAWELDLGTLELNASEHCKANFGRSRSEPFSYDDLNEAIDPRDRDRMRAAVDEAIRTGSTYDIEYRIIRSDGAAGWVQVRGQPLYADDGSPSRMVGVSTDITARKTAEHALIASEVELRELNATLETRVGERTEELTRAHEALRQSQKMEAVGQLTGGIAHDFNNLLAGISGALELLSKRLSEGRLNGMERYIDAAQGSAQRAASLTQRLLAFSRRQTLDPKPTDVNRLINGMEDLIRRSVGPDVEVEVVGAGGLWPTRIDQSQLENALLNLCINARDAMAPDGGRLTIETCNKWLDDRAAHARELPPGQYISLCVTDTGTGMPPEVQAQAFDPFFTTKPLGQGTGLGLSMIHGFVRQSGGQVRIYSEMGKGTTMCLYLPRYQGDVDGDEDVGATPVAEGGHGETVLIIDDEETVRMLVAEVLGDAGYNVIEAPDGPSGLEILRSERRVDLLVSDVGLPGGMNGRQVADAARVTRPDLKVLFITGYAENAAVGNGLLAPGMEVLTKPFVMGDLAAKVHDMMEAAPSSSPTDAEPPRRS